MCLEVPAAAGEGVTCLGFPGTERALQGKTLAFLR